MRRLVDSVLPFFCALAVIPLLTHWIGVPESIRSVFEQASLAWAGALLIGCGLTFGGIQIRRRKPPLAYALELSGLIIAGVFSALYGGALFVAFGPARGWVASMFSLGIGTYFLARARLIAGAKKAVPRKAE